MLGWFSAATARASRSKRSENLSWDTLMATSRLRRGSRARYTSPIPPAPMGLRISYGPSFVPTESCMKEIQLSLSDQEGDLAESTAHPKALHSIIVGGFHQVGNEKRPCVWGSPSRA